MAQSISLWGATYNNVPAVELPKSPSGTATFTDVTDTTAAAADVAAGKYFYTAAGVRTAGTGSGGGGGGYVTQDENGYIVLPPTGGGPVLTTKAITANGTYNASSDNADGYSSVTVNVSGGGGVSNVVIGTFTPDSADVGTAFDISLPYSGSGYPIMLNIFPTEGSRNTGGTLCNIIKNYGIVIYSSNKNFLTGDYAVPLYTATMDYDESMCTVRYKNSTSSGTSIGASNGYYNYVYNSAGAAATYPATCAVFKSSTVLSIFVADTSYGFIPDIEYRYVAVYSS